MKNSFIAVICSFILIALCWQSCKPKVDKQTEISSRLEVINAESIQLDSRVKTQETLADIEQTLQTPLTASGLPVASILREIK